MGTDTDTAQWSVKSNNIIRGFFCWILWGIMGGDVVEFHSLVIILCILYNTFCSATTCMDFKLTCTDACAAIFLLETDAIPILVCYHNPYTLDLNQMMS